MTREFSDQVEEDVSGIISHIANKYWLKYKQTIPFQDLLDAAYVGYAIAIKYFDENRGAKFKSFLTTVVSQRISRFCTINLDKYRKTLELTDFMLKITPCIDTDFEDKEIQEHADWIISMSGLNKRELDIFKMSRANYGHKVIAQKYGITRQRVQQINAAAVKKIKATIKRCA